MSVATLRKNLYEIAKLTEPNLEFKKLSVLQLLPMAVNSANKIIEDAKKPKSITLKDLITLDIDFEELCLHYDIEFLDNPKKVFINYYKAQTSEWKLKATNKIKELQDHKEII